MKEEMTFGCCKFVVYDLQFLFKIAVRLLLEHPVGRRFQKREGEKKLSSVSEMLPNDLMLQK